MFWVAESELGYSIFQNQVEVILKSERGHLKVSFGYRRSHKCKIRKIHILKDGFQVFAISGFESEAFSIPHSYPEIIWRLFGTPDCT